MRISLYFQGLQMVEGPDTLSFEGPLRWHWQGVQLPPPPVFGWSVYPIPTRAEDYAHSRPRIFRPSYGPGLDNENSKVSGFDAVVAIKLCEKTKEWLFWGILRGWPNIHFLRWVHKTYHVVCQWWAAKKKLLESKTITKSPRYGIAESVKSCKKAELSGFKA